MNTSTHENKQVKRNKRGHFLPGVSGNPDGCPKGVKKKTFVIRDYILKVFEEQHLKTGEFESWIKHSSRNKEKFYEWVTKLMPKETELSGGLEGGETKIIIVNHIPKEKRVEGAEIGNYNRDL